jgi:uncharacterized protein YbjT (DUF2867 family)
MIKPLILVTGATGKTGSLVVSRLREAGWPVRVLVRGEGPRVQALRQAGAEVVTGDLFDRAQVASAMRGVRRAYFCPPMHPQMIEAAAVFADAAREARLEAIVGLSQWLASCEHPSLHTRQIWEVERMFSAIPSVAHVNLNPGYFADNYLRLADFASLLGVFPVLTGRSRNAPPSNEDIARVAAALLIDPEPHAGKSYRPTGPRLLSGFDMAGILGHLLGRKVRPIELPSGMFAKAARMQGVSAFELLSLRHYIEDHRQGAFERGAPNSVVEELTGQPAEDFETTAQRYLNLPFARRTATNRLRALANFARVPFAPGYDLNGLDRRQTYPSPRYAMASETWKATHTAAAGRETTKHLQLTGELR